MLDTISHIPLHVFKNNKKTTKSKKGLVRPGIIGKIIRFFYKRSVG